MNKGLQEPVRFFKASEAALSDMKAEIQKLLLSYAISFDSLHFNTFVIDQKREQNCVKEMLRCFLFIIRYSLLFVFSKDVYFKIFILQKL